MDWSLSLIISLNFNRGHFRSGLTSFITIISIIGIILGIAVLIIGLSTVNGFERELNKRILTVIPHVEIESINQPWENWNETQIKMKRIPGITASAPYINFTGLLESKINLHVVNVKGVNPQQENILSIIPRLMQDEVWSSFKAGNNQIIIGKGVADILQIKLGDWISIMIPNISNSYKLQLIKRKRLNVIGIFQLDNKLDHNFTMIPLEDARKYLDMNSDITGIAIKVSDIFNVGKLMNIIKNNIDDNLSVRSWIDTYGYIYRDIKMVRSMIYFVMILVIIIAYFNIISTLMMSVKNKSNDIAILRTLGAKNKLIYCIFIWYSLIVNFISSLCGVIIGTFTSLYLTSIIKYIEKLVGHKFLFSNVYFIDFLPSELHWIDVIYILIITTILSLLASCYPAYRANCINPVRILSS